MQALILAGGLGTRLRSAVSDVPKPLSPVGPDRRPFLSILIDKLINQGIGSIIISAYYLHEQIESFLSRSRFDAEVRVIVDSAPLGTGGAVYHAVKKINITTPFFVFNGDTYFDFPCLELYTKHLEKSSDVVMALKKISNPHRYGVVVCAADGAVVDFPPSVEIKDCLVNAGTYLICPGIFSRVIPSADKFLLEDYLSKNLHALSVQGMDFPGHFIDIGTPHDFNRAKEFFSVKS